MNTELIIPVNQLKKGDLILGQYISCSIDNQFISWKIPKRIKNISQKDPDGFQEIIFESEKEYIEYLFSDSKCKIIRK